MHGWVAEWLKAPVLKTGKGATPSWVQIPPHPPHDSVFKRPITMTFSLIPIFNDFQAHKTPHH